MIVWRREVRSMEFQDVFTDLRKKAGLSQSDAADRLFVTRQAVSRWERGETVPETETLLAISKLFGVSINTLLGSPRTLVCQSCGMPLSDDYLAREADGSPSMKNTANGAGWTERLRRSVPWKRWWNTASR